MQLDKWLILSLIIASAIRIPYVMQESVWNDETVYMWLGSQIKHNPLMIFSEKMMFHSYGYLISIFTAILGLFTPTFFSSRISTFLVSLIGISYTYLLASKLTNKWGGITAAILLSTNPEHIFFSVRALTDIYLATTLTLFVYYSLKLDNSKKSGILFSTATLSNLLSRVSGILTFLLAGYVLIKKYFTNKKFSKSIGTSLLVLGGFIIIVLFANTTYFGNPLKFGHASLKGGIFTGSRAFYLEQSEFLYGKGVFILGLLGSYFAFKNKNEILPISAGLYLFWFSLLAGEKVPRYVLQTIPLVIILAVYGLWKILEIFKVDKRAVLGLSLIALLTAPQALSLVKSKELTYTGFQELGKTVNQLDSQYHFSKIYCQSGRQIRAFSGIEYKGDGGKIVALPKNLEAFANQTNILVQLDIWEYTAPKWAYPLTQEKLNNLLATNFTVVAVVQREIPTQQGLQKAPVGFLLAK